MRFKALLLSLLLALAGACRRPHPRLLPEISPPLAQEEVCAWKGAPAWNVLFPCAGGIGWIDPRGRVVACDAPGAAIREIFAPALAPSLPSLHGRFLVWREEASGRFLAFDLEEGQVKMDPIVPGAGPLLGAGAEGLVCLEEGSPALRPWASPQEAVRADERDERFLSCHFLPERVVVLGQNRLFYLPAGGRRFASRPLPVPAASPGLCDEGALYYGSGRRTLVKLARDWTRAEWELSLGQALERRPLAFAGAVVASPADHTVLRVNRRGTILWWRPLGATLDFDLVAMEENLAAVLLNRTIRFLDPRQGRSTVFADAPRLFGPPLSREGSLYYLSGEGEDFRLLRLGNRYGVDVELEPAAAYWAGKSLRFTLRAHNLVAPSWECTVLDAEGKAVFQRRLTAADNVDLAWVPPRPGAYRIRARAQGRNREGQAEATVQVHDPLRAAPFLFLQF